VIRGIAREERECAKKRGWEKGRSPLSPFLLEGREERRCFRRMRECDLLHEAYLLTLVHAIN
jgi:hypothetical protein